jgi:hypothetical protein
MSLYYKGLFILVAFYVIILLVMSVRVSFLEMYDILLEW